MFTFKFYPSTSGNKVADVELHFTDTVNGVAPSCPRCDATGLTVEDDDDPSTASLPNPLAGLRLRGFSIRRGGVSGALYVQYPHRTYTSPLGGEKRFMLFLPITETVVAERFSRAILDAYDRFLKGASS